MEDNNDSSDWKEQYEFFNNHAITPLVSGLNQYVEDNNIKKAWKESVYSNIYTYFNLVMKQKQILDAFKSVPVVVVKGTSAAKYYLKPQLRTMGDIDLLVKPENCEDAVVCLMNIGCIEIRNPVEVEAGRHRSFRYNEVSIELHHYFFLQTAFRRPFDLTYRLNFDCNRGFLSGVKKPEISTILSHLTRIVRCTRFRFIYMI